MNIKRTIAATAVGLIGVTGIAAGVASATTNPSPSKPPAATTSAPGSQADVQQGDQTAPDAPGTANESTTNEPATNEPASTGVDNPAGHADPPGNVQHNGGANEG